MLNFSLGFLLASLIQASIIYMSEMTGLSTLHPQFGAGQLLVHLLVGQAAGFLLWLLLSRFGRISNSATWLIGAVYGVVLWSIVLPVAARQGTITAPWVAGSASVFTSLLAFATFGILAAATITRAALVQND